MREIKELQMIVGMIIKLRIDGLTEAEYLILNNWYKKYGNQTKFSAPAHFASDSPTHKIRTDKDFSFKRD